MTGTFTNYDLKIIGEPLRFNGILNESEKQVQGKREKIDNQNE